MHPVDTVNMVMKARPRRVNTDGRRRSRPAAYTQQRQRARVRCEVRRPLALVQGEDAQRGKAHHEGVKCTRRGTRATRCDRTGASRRRASEDGVVHGC